MTANLRRHHLCVFLGEPRLARKVLITLIVLFQLALPACNDDQTGGIPDPEEIKLSLIDIEHRGTETALLFEYEFDETARAVERGEAVPLSWWSSSTEFLNLEDHAQGNHTRVDSLDLDSGIYRFEIITGPVKSPDEPVAIEFDRIAFPRDDADTEDVDVSLRYEVTIDEIPDTPNGAEGVD